MSKLGKRLMAYVLVVIMIISLLPATTFATDTTNPIDTEDELLAAIEAEPYGTVTLGGNITVSDTVYLTNGDLTIDLNGYNITCNENEAVILVDCGALTIKGDGTIKNASGKYAIKVVSDEYGSWDSRVYLEGGTYDGDGEDGAEGGSIFVGNATTAIITGGTFKNEIIVEDGARNVYISAGTFVTNPEEYISDSADCELKDGVYVVNTPMSDEFKAILNEDGKFVADFVKPENEEEVMLFFMENELMWEKYEDFQWSNFSDDYTTCDISYNYNDELYIYEETHRVEIVYNYDEDMKVQMDDILDNLPEGEDGEIYYYTVRDMELINWWINSNDINSFIDYSGELKQYIKYKNFKIDCRMGEDAEFHTWAEGFAPIMNDGIMYGSISMGVKANHIIYLPDNAGSTSAELIAAAKKRIDEYVGAGKVQITYGGQDVYQYFIDKYDEDIDYYTAKLNEALDEIARLEGLMAECETTKAECEAISMDASTKIMDYMAERNRYQELINTDPANAASHQAQVDYYDGLIGEQILRMDNADFEWATADNKYYEYNADKQYCENFDKNPSEMEKIWAVERKQNFIDEYNDEDGEYYYLQSAEGGYWFNMTIGDDEHMFIVAKDSDNMVTPEYKSSDISTDITVSSDDTSIPLDTFISVDKLTSGDTYREIIDLLDVEKHETFDIKLFSNSLDDYITKLENGKFRVKIPIDSTWDVDNLIVYYVDEDKKICEYDVDLDEDVEPKYVSFETYHFSIYTLAENPNPVIEPGNDIPGGADTGDIANMWLWLAVLGLSATVLGRVAVARKKAQIER